MWIPWNEWFLPNTNGQWNLLPKDLLHVMYIFDIWRRLYNSTNGSLYSWNFLQFDLKWPYGMLTLIKSLKLKTKKKKIYDQNLSYRGVVHVSSWYTFGVEGPWLTSEDMGHMPRLWTSAAKMFRITFAIAGFQQYLLCIIDYKCSMKMSNKNQWDWRWM